VGTNRPNSDAGRAVQVITKARFMRSEPETLDGKPAMTSASISTGRGPGGEEHDPFLFLLWPSNYFDRSTR